MSISNNTPTPQNPTSARKLTEAKSKTTVLPFRIVKVQDYLEDYPLMGTYLKKIESRFEGNFDYLIQINDEEIVRLLGVSDLRDKFETINEGTYVNVFCSGFLNYSNGMKKIVATVLYEE